MFGKIWIIIYEYIFGVHIYIYDIINIIRTIHRNYISKIHCFFLDLFFLAGAVCFGVSPGCLRPWGPTKAPCFCWMPQRSRAESCSGSCGCTADAAWRAKAASWTWPLRTWRSLGRRKMKFIHLLGGETNPDKIDEVIFFRWVEITSNYGNIR